MEITVHLNEEVSNLFENLALRLAEKNAGLLRPVHLIPYLPFSLELIEDCLDHLVDDRDILREDEEHLITYRFVVFEGAVAKHTPLTSKNCIACDAHLEKQSASLFCAACMKKLLAALDKAADECGWPAQAVYEHELIHLASSSQKPVHAEELAARSRYTLRSTRKKLDAMSLKGYLEKNFDADSNTVVYNIPPVTYSMPTYRHNMHLIQQFPAAMMEDIQLRITRILFALGGFILVIFFLAFLRVPPPLLLLLFLFGAPAIALVMWWRRNSIEE